MMIPQNWQKPLKSKLSDDYLEQVVAFVQSSYQEETIYPPKQQIFTALEKTPLDHTKVVIVGQDPYHGPNQAQGLAFSVPNNQPAPPSLRNIFKELATDLQVAHTTHDLTPWANQGVLLLNSVLTVKDGQANAHAGLIWEPLTDAIIQITSQDDRPKVFILWGKFAQSKAQLIDETKHLVIKSAHPSPLSAYRGFFGSRPFSKTNQFLVARQQEPINW